MSRGASIDTSFARSPLAVGVRAAFEATVLAPIQWTFAPMEVEGRHHLEEVTGPAVYAAHHESHADTMVIGRAVGPSRRRRLAVAAAADYFFPGPWVGRAAALAFGAIPVQRDQADRRALRQSLELLADGWSLIVYPEGGRSPAGVLRPFLPGAAWIARRADVPLVPAHIEGTGAVLPKGRWIPRRAPVRVRFGPPLRPRPEESARELNARLESAAAALAGVAGRSTAREGAAAGDDPLAVAASDPPAL